MADGPTPAPSQAKDTAAEDAFAPLKRHFSSLVIQVDRLRSEIVKAGIEDRSLPTVGWTLREVVGHLVNVDAQIWGPRMEKILAESDPYFDDIDQNLLVRESRWREKNILDILAQLMRVRWNYASLLAKLTPEQLDRTGVHYERGAITIRDIVRIIVEHDEHHLAQIRRMIDEGRDV